MSAAVIVKALGGQWFGSYGLTFCPCHNDGRSPGLKVADDPRKSDGIDLHCFAGCDWRDVKDALRQRGLLEPRDGEQPERSQKERAENCANSRSNPNGAKARAIWSETQPIAGSVAERYLIGRALRPPFPPSLRFHPNLKHGPTGLHFPALVAAVQGPDDEVTAVQRTFLLPDGRGKAQVSDPKMTLGSIGPGAVRLAAAGPALGIAEGIETALSAMQLFRLPVWAAIGSRLDRIALPSIVKRVVVFADNGQAGIQAAHKAAVAYTKQRRKVSIRAPSIGKDWNDALRAKGAA